MTMSEEELRRRVSGAYDDVLEEPVPDRLSSLLVPPPRKAKVIAFPLTWAQLGGMAASVLVGIAIGTQWPSQPGGGVVAGDRVARALDTQLASDTPAGVRVQLSFVDRDGRYCRTFAAGQLAGLACKKDSRWDGVAASRASGAATGEMRQAASALPPAVLDAVDARIAGDALDAAQERTARDRGWKK